MKVTIELDQAQAAALPPVVGALLPILLELLKRWLEKRGDAADVSPNP